MFASLERRFGEFTEFLGAEREHQSTRGGTEVAAGARAWVHPTYTTVGSALRLVTERATEAGGKSLSAVVLVPDEPTAAWRPLLRHFCVEGRLREGGTQVEMCELGQWRTRALQRPTLVLSYPRASGESVRRVWTGGTQARVQLEGTVLYLPRGKGGKGARGQLYVVIETLDVANEAATRWSDRGVPTVAVAELLLTDASRTRTPAGAAAHRYEISFRKEGRDRPGGSFYLDPMGGFQPWQVDVDLLYEVTKLVKSHEGKRLPTTGWVAESEYASIAKTQYAFNFVTAEAEIAAALRVQPVLTMPAAIADSDSGSEAGAPVACLRAERAGGKPRERRAEQLRLRMRSPQAGLVPVSSRVTALERARAVTRGSSKVVVSKAQEPAAGAGVELRRSTRATVEPDRLSESVGASGAWSTAKATAAVVPTTVVLGVRVTEQGRVPGLQGHDRDDSDSDEESEEGVDEDHSERIDYRVPVLPARAGSELPSPGVSAQAAANKEKVRAEAHRARVVQGLATARALQRVAELAADSAADQLAAARAAAAEAVAARKRPVPMTAEEIANSAVRRKMRAAAAAGLIDPLFGRTHAPCPPMVMTCRSAATICNGCKQPIGVGNPMVGKSTGVLHHNRPGCAGAQFEEARAMARHAPPPGATDGERAEAYEQAMEELYVTTPAPAVARQPPATVAASQALARAKELLAKAPPPKVLNRADEILVAKVSSARTDSAIRCMLGTCGVAATTPKIECTAGCGRSVHASCIGLSKSFASLGQFKCAVCRASLMNGGAAPTPLLVRSAAKSMLWEISVGKQSTAQGYAEYQRLEKDWVSSMGGGAVSLPRDSEESFVAFLIWLAAESGRARSFTTVWRAAAGVCARTREVSMTKGARVKRIYNEIVAVLGELAVPCTQLTRRIIRLMLGTGTSADSATLHKRCIRSAGGNLILARSRVLVILEIMGGLRVGESTGCVHGIKANNVSLLQSKSGACAELGETVEVEVLDSKTGPGRHVNFVGTSVISKIPSAQYIRDLWKAYGLSTKVFIDGGFRVEQADYIVVKVSLLGMSVGELARLQRELKKEEMAQTCYGIASAARVSVKYILERTKAADIAESRRYVNVAGGATGSDAVLGARRWLIMRGFGSATSLVPGPFLRATESGSGALTHMPLQEGSTYTHHCAAMKSAYEISAAMEEPDLELDLNGESKPKFANHSARRAADRVARETQARSGVSTMDIDVHFGWLEAQRRKDMQLHYQGKDRAQRVRRARVTMYM